MVDRSVEDNRPDPEQTAARTPRTVSSRDLLGGERLLVIQHEEEVYRLQLTAAGKLILTK
jgi:hemin uptake protein HemP